MRVFHVLNPLARSAVANDSGVHVLLHLSAVRTAPHLDQKAGLDAYTQGVLTVPASLVGLPVLSVPIEFSEEVDGCLLKPSFNLAALYPPMRSHRDNLRSFSTLSATFLD